MQRRSVARTFHMTQWLVPSYTAWWQRHTCVSGLPREIGLLNSADGESNPQPLDKKNYEYKVTAEPLHVKVVPKMHAWNVFETRCIWKNLCWLALFLSVFLKMWLFMQNCTALQKCLVTRQLYVHPGAESSFEFHRVSAVQRWPTAMNCSSPNDSDNLTTWLTSHKAHQ